MENYSISDTQISSAYEFEVIKKLYSFLYLNDGWDYGEGEKITYPVLNKAEIIFYEMQLKGFFADAFPTIDGGVNLSFWSNNTKDNFIEITIQKNLEMLLVLENGRGIENKIISEKENAKESDIIELISQIENECNSIELSTLDIFIKKNADFNQMLLLIPQMEAGFLSFNTTALPIQESWCATI